MATESASLSRDDAAVRARVDAEFAADVARVAPRSVPQKLAIACRYLFDQGHAASLAGQVSARLDDGTIWTSSLRAGFGMARVSNLIRVDDDLRVVEGQGMANPATRFHLWVYAKRPDVRSIVHTHPPHASALAITGRQLQVAHMDMMMFHDDLAYLPDWPGVPLANEEGHLIAEALGTRHTILLANHGVLAAGRSIEHATHLAAFFEMAARVQLLAEASGQTIKPVDPAHARDAYQLTNSEPFVNANFDYWARLTLRRHPDVLD